MSDEELEGWRRFVSVRLAGRTALVCAAVLALPFCLSGIFMDDYHQQLLMEGNSPLHGSRWDLFTMAPRDPARVQQNIADGHYAWWMLPSSYFVFVRPLSVALANLDHFLFGRAFWLQHLHSLAWYVALAAVVTIFLRRALGRTSRIAALAAVLFVIDGSHAMVVGWLANRNALVAALPTLLGILAHVRWREQRAWRFLPLSLLGYAAGLAGGESALGALAYLAAYELTVAPGPVRSRLLALTPVAVLGVGYVVIYGALGAGTHGSELYVDPVGAPLSFLAQAPGKALTLASGLFLGQTASLWMLGPSVRPVLVGLGLCAVGLMAALVRRLWPRLEESERRGLRWLTLGAGLSLIPSLATFPMNRLLLAASVGGSALVAVVLRHGWRAVDDRFARGGARVLFVTMVLGGMSTWLGSAPIQRLAGDLMTRTALETSLSDQELSGRVVVFVAPDASAAMYSEQVRRWNHKPPAKSWVTLSFAHHPHRLTRTGPKTVELEVVGGRLLETTFEVLFRAAAAPLLEGTRVRLVGAELTVVGLDRGLPNRLRLDFDEDPEGGSYTLAGFEGGTLTRFVLPAVGQTRELPMLTSLLSL